MRRLTLVGMYMVLLWSLSPVGGQASLRLLSKGDWFTTSVEKWRYMSTGPGATEFGKYFQVENNFEFAGPMFAAALLASNTIKSGPMDTWGHVKIPYRGNLTTNDWVTAKSNNKTEDYVSLVGIPVVRSGSSYADTTVEFSLETSYLDLQCGVLTRLGPLPPQYNFSTRLSLLPSLVPGKTWPEMSEDLNPFKDSEISAPFFFQTDLPLYPYDNGSALNFSGSRHDAYFGFENKTEMEKLNTTFSGPRTITFASYPASYEDSYYNVTNCSLTQQHVEVMVVYSRTRNGCRAERIRKSCTDTRPTNFTPFEHIVMGVQFLRALPKGILHAEEFLFDPEDMRLFGTGAQGDERVDWSRVPPDLISRRLSIILNTYFQLSIAPSAYTRNLPRNSSLYGAGTLPVTDIEQFLPNNLSISNTPYKDWFGFALGGFNNASGYTYPFIGATTNATVTRGRTIYKCNFAWIGVLYSVCTVVIVV
jgi:hypothetical protein